jgi:hypothetical protein
MTEPDEMAITGLQLIKHDPLATNTHEKILELSEAVYEACPRSIRPWAGKTVLYLGG